MSLKELRRGKGLTQSGCAAYLGIPLRTYSRYESNEDKIDPIKYRYIIEKLEAYGFIDEEHGVLTVDRIKEICADVLPGYQAEFCYLFGSYAKDKQTETSDVDLLVSVPEDGLKYFELVETLREKLKKKVDLLDLAQLDHNPSLAKEILKEGVKIYG